MALGLGRDGFRGRVERSHLGRRHSPSVAVPLDLLGSEDPLCPPSHLCFLGRGGQRVAPRDAVRRDLEGSRLVVGQVCVCVCVCVCITVQTEHSRSPSGRGAGRSAERSACEGIGGLQDTAE